MHFLFPVNILDFCDQIDEAKLLLMNDFEKAGTYHTSYPRIENRLKTWPGGVRGQRLLSANSERGLVKVKEHREYYSVAGEQPLGYPPLLHLLHHLLASPRHGLYVCPREATLQGKNT